MAWHAHFARVFSYAPALLQEVDHDLKSLDASNVSIGKALTIPVIVSSYDDHHMHSRWAL